TDNTREIVKEFTDKLYDYQWKNDFSDARNFAASKATGQWIFVLDADEYVEQENLLRAIEEIREHHGTYDMYAVNIINFAGHN
ncbi:glycosyltransferase, partial [Acinetobacter baumannii]